MFWCSADRSGDLLWMRPRTNTGAAERGNGYLELVTHSPRPLQFWRTAGAAGEADADQMGGCHTVGAARELPSLGSMTAQAGETQAAVSTMAAAGQAPAVATGAAEGSPLPAPPASVRLPVLTIFPG